MSQQSPVPVAENVKAKSDKADALLVKQKVVELFPETQICTD